MCCSSQQPGASTGGPSEVRSGLAAPLNHLRPWCRRGGQTKRWMNTLLRRTRDLSRPLRARLPVAPPALFPSKYISSLSSTSIILLSSTSSPAVTTMADFSDKGSTTSSGGWSDEEGDEYLAKALASDDYLQGARVATTCCATTSPPPALGPLYRTTHVLVRGVRFSPRH